MFYIKSDDLANEPAIIKEIHSTFVALKAFPCRPWKSGSRR